MFKCRALCASSDEDNDDTEDDKHIHDDEHINRPHPKKLSKGNDEEGDIVRTVYTDWRMMSM